jgi:hypothetical protein
MRILRADREIGSRPRPRETMSRGSISNESKVCLSGTRSIDITCNRRVTACVMTTRDHRSRSRSLDFSPILACVYMHPTPRVEVARWTLTRVRKSLRGEQFARGITDSCITDSRSFRSILHSANSYSRDARARARLSQITISV